MEPTLSEKYIDKGGDNKPLDDAIKGMRDTDVQRVLDFLISEVNHIREELSSLKGVK